MKNPQKSVKFRISKNEENKTKQKRVFFPLMSQGSLSPNIRFLVLGQKVCSLARVHTDRHTHEGEYRGHPFRTFSFNLSSSARIGPIIQTYHHITLRSMFVPLHNGRLSRPKCLLTGCDVFYRCLRHSKICLETNNSFHAKGSVE